IAAHRSRTGYLDSTQSSLVRCSIAREQSLQARHILGGECRIQTRLALSTPPVIAVVRECSRTLPPPTIEAAWISYLLSVLASAKAFVRHYPILRRPPSWYNRGRGSEQFTIS